MATSLQSFTGLRATGAARPAGAAFAQRAALRPARAAPSLLVEARSREAGVGLFATKAGMTTIFSEGAATPCTVLALEPGNIVTQLKTPEKDGYSAVQVGYKVVKEKNIKKPELGHCQKAGVPPMRFLREFKLDGENATKLGEYEVGQQLNVEEMFEVGAMVDCAGTSIGKGYQGEIKRWGHTRGPMSHGSRSHRRHGSIGSSATPSRVFPGQKMSGQMGNERVKIRKLEVLMVDAEKGAIVVKGSVPGSKGGIIEVTPSKLVGKNVK